MERQGENVITYRIVKRTSRFIVYDKLLRPWYSPWKVKSTRWTITPEGFAALVGNSKVEGERT